MLERRRPSKGGGSSSRFLIHLFLAQRLAWKTNAAMVAANIRCWCYRRSNTIFDVHGFLTWNITMKVWLNTLILYWWIPILPALVSILVVSPFCPTSAHRRHIETLWSTACETDSNRIGYSIFARAFRHSTARNSIYPCNMMPVLVHGT